MAHAGFTALRENLATHFDAVRTEIVVTRQHYEDPVIRPLAEFDRRCGPSS